jgi:hypothetical protein
LPSHVFAEVVNDWWMSIVFSSVAVAFDAGIDDGLRIKYPYRNRHEHRQL